MSGVSDSTQCPICNGIMERYVDWKPFDYSSGQCLDCGFYYAPKTGQMDLEEVNELRADYNEGMDLEGEDELKPLKKKDLAKYTSDIKKFW